MNLFSFALPAFLTSVLVLTAGNAPARYTFGADQSSMTISGTSSLHDWHCEAEDLAGWVETVDATSATPVAQRGEVSVTISDIECGKGLMNKKLRDALSADDHPSVLFVADSITTEGSAWTVTGTLSLGGNQFKIMVPLEGSFADGKTRMEGSVEMSLATLNVKPPTALLGTIKTGDLVTVAFNVVASL